MNKLTLIQLSAIALFWSSPSLSDDLVRIVQQDLQRLGYNIAEANGEVNTETGLAVSQFQAERGLDINGDITPQLAGVIKAEISRRERSARVNPNTERLAQEACLLQKIADVTASGDKKRGFGSLMRVVKDTATRFGKGDISEKIDKVSGDIYAADATAKDIKRAAKDLGLSKSDVKACENPFATHKEAK